MKEPKEIIIETIKSNFTNDPMVQILDPRQDGIHLEAIVVSEEFQNLSLVKRHQKVMGPLRDHFSTFLHALALKTYTPQEWELQQKG